MIVAYLFSFFLFVLLVLFVLLPLLRQSKSTFEPESSALQEAEDIILDDEPGWNDRVSDGAPVVAGHDHNIEIEVAVARARRRKSTFWNCPECGRRMEEADRFCASCGQAR